jgi:cell division protein FtsB
VTGILASGASTSSVSGSTVVLWVGVTLVVFGSVAVVLRAWFQLQAHRNDAVAMASYQKLAEEAVANQQELRTELAKLATKVEAVEKLMRDVG